MAEAESLIEAEFPALLRHLGGKAGARKLRLLNCALCRRVWNVLPGECRRAVDTSERFAAGLAGIREMRRAAAEAVRAAEAEGTRAAEAGLDSSSSPAYRRAAAVRDAVQLVVIATRPPVRQRWAWMNGWRLCSGVDALITGRGGAEIWADHEGWLDKLKRNTEREIRFVQSLLRELFGNPFRPVSVKKSWLSWSGGAVRQLARAIYEERAFDRLPILADALEEAGCDDASLLAHCRGGGEHLRGCWAVDTLLVKS